jgi:hypothetical protein
MSPQDRGLDGLMLPGEATFAVPGEMPLALDLLLLPLSVLLKLTVMALLRGLGAVTACS